MRRVVYGFVGLAAVAPLWIVALRYDAPAAPAEGAGFSVAVELRVIEEYLDLPAVRGRQGSASLTLAGVTAAGDVDVLVNVGDEVASGSLIATQRAQRPDGGTTRRPVFLLPCPDAIGDISPGAVAAGVGCLQEFLISRGAEIPEEERTESRLGLATQAALNDLYHSVGHAPPVSSPDLPVRRIEAEVAVLEARQRLATVDPSDTAGRQIARLLLDAAILRQEDLLSNSGTPFLADDFLVSSYVPVTFDGIVTNGEGATLQVSWGEERLLVDVPPQQWDAVTQAVDRRLRTSSGDVEVVPDETHQSSADRRQIRLRSADATGLLPLGGTGTAPTVRFVIRSSGEPVISVPAIAVHSTGSDQFLIVRQDESRSRIPVVVIEEIAGRAILEASPELEGVEDVQIS